MKPRCSDRPTAILIPIIMLNTWQISKPNKAPKTSSYERLSWFLPARWHSKAVKEDGKLRDRPCSNSHVQNEPPQSSKCRNIFSACCKTNSTKKMQNQLTRCCFFCNISTKSSKKRAPSAQLQGPSWVLKVDVAFFGEETWSWPEGTLSPWVFGRRIHWGAKIPKEPGRGADQPVRRFMGNFPAFQQMKMRCSRASDLIRISRERGAHV